MEAESPEGLVMEVVQHSFRNTKSDVLHQIRTLKAIIFGL
jgi:hypothetical protein